MIENSFFSTREQPTKKELVTQVNRDLTEALNDYFKNHSDNMRQQLIEAGASSQRADEILQEMKRNQQVEMIKRFKLKLKEVALREYEQSKLAI